MWSRFKHLLWDFFLWEPDYGPLLLPPEPVHAPDHFLLTITKITQ